jgi:hypothetical protein
MAAGSRTAEDTLTMAGKPQKKAAKEKRKLALVAEVVAARERRGRERRQLEEQRKAQQRAELIIAISRLEAAHLGYPEEFADELLVRGYSDFEVHDLLVAAARPERLV